MSQTMRGMILEEPRAELRLEKLRRPDGPAERGARQGARLRRVPHRSARARRRAYAARSCPSCSAIKSSEPSNELGEDVEGSSSASASACRGSAGRAASAASARTGGRISASAREFTGYDRDGGFAEYAAADARFALPLPGSFTNEQAAPLLCAGLIGHRALAATGDAERIGLYGFGGGGAHRGAGRALRRAARVRVHAPRRSLRVRRSREVLAASGPATRAASPRSRSTPRIIFAPAGELVPRALARRRTRRNGRVCRHPHERHPVVSLRAPVGRANAAFRRQSHAQGRHRVSRAGGARTPCAPR